MNFPTVSLTCESVIPNFDLEPDEKMLIFARAFESVKR